MEAQEAVGADGRRPGADTGGRARPRRVGRAAQIALIVLLALASASLLAYPYISNWLYHEAQKSVIYQQADAVDSAESADLSLEMRAAQGYNERLRGGVTRVNDPFNPAHIAGAGPEEYWGLLNIAGDGVMGALFVPRVGVETPIYHGTSDDVLEKGAGHVENTSLPVGGPSTHSVLAGHNGLPSVRIFDALEDAEVGDYFIIRVLGEDHAYRIYAIDTVLPNQTESLQIQLDRDLVTLVTCVPYGINDHRLLVHGERCEIPQDWLDRQAGGEGGMGAPGLAWIYDWLPALAGAAFALAVAGIYARTRRRRRPRGLGPRDGGAA